MLFLNLTLRAIMELGIVAGLAYWGFEAGDTPTARIALGVGAPAIAFGFWGLVDFRQAGRFAEPFRLLQELVVSGAAALALYSTGKHALGWGLAAVSVVHHALLYASGQRLLEPRQKGFLQGPGGHDPATAADDIP